MKEIKAYIRKDKSEEVIHAMEEAGVLGFTVIEVKGMCGAAAPEKERFSIDYSEKYCPVVKIEMVCEDKYVESFVGVMKEIAYTGHRGDGMIFVSDIGYAVKIRTGEEGEAALRDNPDSDR